MRIAVAALAPALAMAALGAAGPLDRAYSAQVEGWREAYQSSLKADDGWLTLAGLFWLKEGTNTAGAGEGNEIALPEGSAPQRVGVFDFHDGRTTFRAAPGVAVTVNGKRGRSSGSKAGFRRLARSGSYRRPHHDGDPIVERAMPFASRIKTTRRAGTLPASAGIRSTKRTASRRAFTPTRSLS